MLAHVVQVVLANLIQTGGCVYRWTRECAGTLECISISMVPNLCLVPFSTYHLPLPITPTNKSTSFLNLTTSPQPTPFSPPQP